MTELEAQQSVAAHGLESNRPYAPSWVDHLGDWVERQRVPGWAYYAGIGVAVLVIQTIALGLEGALQLPGVWLGQAYLAGAMAFILALIQHLDWRAIEALATLRPALQADDEERWQMSYRLSNLPARATVLASLAVVAIIVLNEAIGQPYRPQGLMPFPISVAMARGLYFVCWFVFGAFLYHTAHQLRIINHIYTRHTSIDLFRPKPLYAFSNLAALTAGSLAMISYGWLLANPWVDRSDPQVLAPMFVLLLFAAFTFVWPQFGIHRLQANEKERLLDEVARRFKSTTEILHRKMDAGELDGIAELNVVLTSLEIERNALRKRPTWPWEPEVARLLVTALALPLGLWLVQLILQRILGQ